MPSSNVKVGGVWKSAQPWVKVSGTWQSVKSGWVKVSGAWQQFYSSGLFLTSGIDGAGSVGYSNSPAFGSFSPTSTLSDGKVISDLSDYSGGTNESYFSLFCPTYVDPGQSYFSTLNGVTSASAQVYVWTSGLGIALWNWNDAAKFGLVNGVTTLITIAPSVALLGTTMTEGSGTDGFTIAYGYDTGGVTLANGAFGSMTSATLTVGGTVNGLVDLDTGYSYLSIAIGADPGISFFTTITVGGVQKTSAGSSYFWTGSAATWSWGTQFGLDGAGTSTVVIA